MRDNAANVDSPDGPRTPLRSARASSNPLQDHALPSAEFTFSCSPSSTGRLTPVSSVDGSLDPQVEQRSLTPNTQSLFQNLRLSETMRHQNHASETNPSSGPRESRLTPNAHHTTYRDLYNATPSPGVAPSTEPTQRLPQTPVSPLGVVNAHLQNLNLADSGDPGLSDSDHDNDSESAEVSLPDNNSDDDDVNDDYLYNIRQEELPQVPIYDIRLQTALRNVRGQLADLAQVMSRRELAQDPTSAFHELYKQTLEASGFAYPATRTVGFIGDSGMGKSSLINSILDQEGLARSSGDGAACTTVVTEFRSVNEEHPQNYTVEADFMDNAEIRELLEELLSNVRKYYTDAYREVVDAREQENIKAAAKRAWDTLLSLFPNQPGLDLDFLSRDGEDAVESIVTTLQEWAMAGLDHRPGGRDSLRYTVVARHADGCMEQLDNLMADSREGDRPAIWPFVKLIRVYLRSPVLRTGLVLADLPGFRDLNYARERATERYLRHSCDEVFIVSTIIRCTTDQSIGDIIRRCAQGQPIRIVCTRSEDVDAKETARTSSAGDARRILDLDNRIQTLDKRIRHTRSRRRQASGSRNQNLAAEETTLRLKRFLILRRNRRVTEALSRAWKNQARIFCVSNKLYADHRANDHEQANGYLELSGITELRRYCQSVPADAQLRATESFLQNQVPALLGSLTQWALAGSDSVTASRAEVLRDALKEAEQTLQRFSERFHNNPGAGNSRNTWRDDAVGASREWATWHHSTYTAWCRNYGTHQTAKQDYRCWNEEILGHGSDQLSTRWDTMLGWLEEQRDDLDEELSSIFQHVCDLIEEHHDIAPDSLGNLRLNIKTRQRCILDAIHSSLDDLIYATEKIKSDAIGGHASSYIAGVMRPVYNACREQYGTGSDARRKQTMNRHLSSSALFLQFSNALTGDYRELIERTFDQLDQKLREEIANITRDLRASLTVEGQTSEAGQDPQHTEELKRRRGFDRNVRVKFIFVDSAPTPGQEFLINDVKYQKSLKQTGGFQTNQKAFAKVLSRLSELSGVSYEFDTQSFWRSNPDFPNILQSLVERYRILGPHMSPETGKLAIRAPCPHKDCGLADKHGINNQYHADGRITFVCPDHGEHHIDLTSPHELERIEFNTPLRNLIRILLCSVDTDTSWIMCTGSDYSGFYQEQLTWRLLEHPENAPVIFYTPLILDWSGAKLSKSLYIRENGYKYLIDAGRQYLLDADSFLEIEGGIEALFEEAQDWVDKPYKLFRNYTVDYIDMQLISRGMRLLRHPN
ncbi:hypothetical protein Asppvi_011073 [Aspergillus pseudoviridinutans]|uniref:G domain-containing protein n=1 Tax=Aspergillus pseudoviridinutans TaxID=1517512 RepID=A0A9P3BNH4_9EURO|nr:uncharacterized protein Asppvi_011073 [Aspergillus pseudoviridinutans]GIJ92098.1 hypothetical protein Asppvi_011073 [Aspergillus pseudoviridinutans]